MYKLPKLNISIDTKKNYHSFGEMLYNERILKNLTLREFCRKYDFDPAQVSKIENNLLKVPKSKAFIKKIAKAIGVSVNSEDYEYLCDLADISRGEIPQDLQSNLSILPAFFRKARGKKITEKDLKELVKLITAPESGPSKNPRRD